MRNPFKKYGHIRTRYDEMKELDEYWKDGFKDIRLFIKYGKIDDARIGSCGSFSYICGCGR
jgi:hypothetical protein